MIWEMRHFVEQELVNAKMGMGFKKVQRKRLKWLFQGQLAILRHRAIGMAIVRVYRNYNAYSQVTTVVCALSAFEKGITAHALQARTTVVTST